MRAHIIGGGFGGLAAAALLILNGGVPGEDITIYEADEQVGGGFFLGGSAESGYSLPGSVFDKEFRCTFELLKSIPSASNPSISVTDEFFAFNTREPYHDKAHIFDRDGRVVHGPRFGLSLGDGLSLARVLLTPEAMLDGRRIEEFFSRRFFSTEFWFLWSTIMGSLPEHSAIEFRRYMNRFLYLFGRLSDMTGVMRTPINQHQAFIEPLVAWLRPRGVNFLTGAFVQDIGFAPSPDRMTVDRLDYERGGSVTSVAVAPEDLVLVTTGSQAADLSAGSMTEAPRPRSSGRSWALWTRLAKGSPKFGKPDAFFGEARMPLSRWVTFTVTDRGTEFIKQISALTGSEPGRGGLVTLKDSGWVLSLSIFHQPEIVGQPPGTSVWWGYGLYPERNGDFVRKRMDQCTGAEILEETLRHLRLDRHLAAVRASSICVPCNMPYVNNVWLPRVRSDRPPAIPEGATNLGLIGQYVEVPKEIAFTIECSVRSAWEVIYVLLKRGPAPPPVYQSQYDPKALFSALKVFVCR
jgi:oleate hydratase